MKKLLFLLITIVICSCINERERDIRRTSTMIIYYTALIEYEDSVNNRPYVEMQPLYDSLYHWYDVRHNLIVNE